MSSSNTALAVRRFSLNRVMAKLVQTAHSTRCEADPARVAIPFLVMNLEQLLRQRTR